MALKEVSFNIKIERDMHAGLMQLAKQNDRTLAAEARVAIRQHLETSNGAAVSPPKGAGRAATKGS